MILGIDQGTTGSTAVLVDLEGKLLGKESVSYAQHYPKPGWVEHQVQDIFSSVAQSVSALLSQTNRKPTDIKAIGITNQRETVSLFEGEKALHPFIVWQDRRTEDACDRLQKHQKLIRKKTGTPVDPYFSSTKIQWLIKHLKLSKKNKNIRFRTIDSYLLFKLTGADAIEATNAHRTQLLSLKKLAWDEELFDLFGIPLSFAPPVVPSEGFEFHTRSLSFLPDGIPVVAALGDQQAALFGQMGFHEGAGKMTYGTGAFILCNTGEKAILSKNKLVSTLALQWKDGRAQYALEGSAFICGAWIQWLRDQLQIISHASDIEKLAEEVDDSAGVIVIPALTGMGAPFWKTRLRGSIQGLTRGVGRAHIARASLEALAFQNKALAEAMVQDSKKSIHWRVDGGAAQNNLLMQIQANSLQQNIVRPKNFEATATGAALLAGVSKGFFRLDDLNKLWEKDRDFSPEPANKKYYKESYLKWCKRVESS